MPWRELFSFYTIIFQNFFETALFFKNSAQIFFFNFKKLL